MLSFTIIKTQNSTRYAIYDSYGFELALVTSFEHCLKYFYDWCVKLASKSVTFTPTKDANVILVRID